MDISTYIEIINRSIDLYIYTVNEDHVEHHSHEIFHFLPLCYILKKLKMMIKPLL